MHFVGVIGIYADHVAELMVNVSVEMHAAIEKIGYRTNLETQV